MDTILPLLEEAERCLVDGDVNRAAALYRGALELGGGDSPLPILGLARVGLLLGRLDEAQRLVQRALASHPGSVQALTLQGAVDEARGDLDSALAAAERACGVDPTYGPAHLNRGRLLAQRERWAEAVEALDEAQRLAPGLPAAPLLAVARFKLGDAAAAVRGLVWQLDRQPDDVDALVTLVDTLAEVGQAPLAVELLDHALGRLPRVAVLHARRSALAVRTGDIRQARASVARQLELVPDDEEALLFAASLDLSALDLAAAEARLARVLQLDPACWRAHHLLGIVFESLRLRPAALVAYRAAITHGPGAWEPRNNLAALLLERPSAGAAAEARALLEQALAIGPVEATVRCRYNLALALWHLGDRQAARRNAAAVASSSDPGPVVDDARRFLEVCAPPRARTRGVQELGPQKPVTR